MVFCLEIEVVFGEGFQIFFLESSVVVPDSNVEFFAEIALISALYAGTGEFDRRDFFANDLFASTLAGIGGVILILAFGYFPRYTVFVVHFGSASRTEVSFVSLVLSKVDGTAEWQTDDGDHRTKQDMQQKRNKHAENKGYSAH